MISCTEFIWVYAALFRFLEEKGGKEKVIEFWKGISDNFLGNLRELVEAEGLKGMHRYWSHTLGEEGGRHVMTLYDDMFVIDMHECPSAKLIFQEGRGIPYEDYCEHCRWLYPPLLAEYGYEADMDILDCRKGRCRLTVRARGEASRSLPPGCGPVPRRADDPAEDGAHGEAEDTPPEPEHA